MPNRYSFNYITQFSFITLWYIITLICYHNMRLKCWWGNVALLYISVQFLSFVLYYMGQCDGGQRVKVQYRTCKCLCGIMPRVKNIFRCVLAPKGCCLMAIVRQVNLLWSCLNEALSGIREGGDR